MKLCTAILTAALVSPALALDVTVYNQDLGLVRDVRSLELKKGRSDLRLTDVAARIDATSVLFKSLSDPSGTRVLEQNYQFDLINPDKLMDKYLGREIELDQSKNPGDKKSLIKGTLLSTAGGRVLKVGDQILVNPPGNPVLPELPEGLVTKPTLAWTLQSARGGTQQCEIAYLTSGLTWQADYVLSTNADDTQMDANAWVTLTNTSGAAYKDAKLKLVAGDVNRAPQPDFRQRFMKASMVMEDAVGGAQFNEKSFFEYHLYTLERPATLADNETKQIEMASAANVPIKKQFIYDGANNDKKVFVVLEFKNTKENNLGFALPKGRVRVYKKDTDGSAQLIGEDAIDHTPKDEPVRIKMGSAFDVVGERKQTDFQTDNNRRSSTESMEIKLRNHKNEAVQIRVVEHLNRWNEWKVTASSQKFEKKDAGTIEFLVPVPKDGESTVTYTVKYSW